MMKKLFAMLLSLAMLICLFAGCAGTSKPEEEPTAEPSTSEPAAEKESPVFYYVGPRAGGLAWNQSKEGFEAAIAELGIEGYFVAPQTPFNNSEVLELTNTAITNGADIVMGAYSDPSIFKSICDEMRDKGIVVAALGNYSECVDVQVAPTYEVMGDRFCDELDALVTDASEQLNILLIGSAAGIKTDAFVASIEAYCAERGNAKLVDIQFAQGDAILGADVTASTLRAYPEINCIICYDATSGLGCGTYVMENGLDDLYVLVEANSGDCINAVLNGGIDKLVNWEYYDMGYQATKNAVSYYYGEDVEPVSSVEPSVITTENAAEYAERFGISLNG